VTWATLTILGVPFAVPLAVLMAFLDLIPLVGATIGGVLIGIVTLFHAFPTSTIVWIVVLIVYQQVENNVIQPVVYRRTVAIHPLIVIVAVLIGGSLLGILGAILAIPIAATLQIVVKELWQMRRARLLPDNVSPPPIAPEGAA
jgi:predicted PurR-regulated permease PerM